MNNGASRTILDLFTAESRGDPLGSFPSLAMQGKPYNLWLTEQVLDPVLARWRDRPGANVDSIAAVSDDFSWGSYRVRAAYKEILPAAATAGEPAVLAAMGVTANLQRTLGILGEHIIGGGRLEAAPPAIPGPLFHLSRLWCGLVEYPENSPYFTSRIRQPLHPGRLQPKRRDPRHLANALWCSLAAITGRCDETIATLREEIVRCGIYTPDDVRRLHARSKPSRGKS